MILGGQILLCPPGENGSLLRDPKFKNCIKQVFEYDSENVKCPKFL